MRLSKYIEREPQIRRKKAGPKRSKPSIATHRLFLPILIIWGSALLGLAVAVLPEASIERIAALTGQTLTGMAARVTSAGVAAALGGALAFVIGSAIRSAVLKNDISRPLASVLNSERLRLIDPAKELGSESLDSPIVGIPFHREGAEKDEDAKYEPITEEDEDCSGRKPTLGELAERGYEDEEPLPRANHDTQEHTVREGEPAFTRRQFEDALIETCEAANCEASPAPPDAAEEPSCIVAETEAPALPAAMQSVPEPFAALEKLRRKPAEELSLVEMVERFAGALHERQRDDRRRGSSAADGDAALVAALKALTLFTENGFAAKDAGTHGSTSEQQIGDTERELRDALAKLQTLRGAA